MAALALAGATVASDPSMAAGHTAAKTSADRHVHSAASARGPIEVALTFDDLPQHGPEVHGVTPLWVVQAILATLRKHQTPPMYGFVNGNRLAPRPELRDVLHAWLAAGHPLGNHTFSHADLEAISLQAYENDILRNEPILQALMVGGPRDLEWKMFRYPYLREGATLATREAVRQFLYSHGYRIAEVTIDFGDWAWNPPYARCLQRHDGAAISALRQSYLSEARAALAWSHAAALAVVGRPIRQVLLLHVGVFDALMLDALLTAYEAEGVTFVSLDEALDDPFYGEDSGEHGGKLLEQFITARHPRNIAFIHESFAMVDDACLPAPRGGAELSAPR